MRGFCLVRERPQDHLLHSTSMQSEPQPEFILAEDVFPFRFVTARFAALDLVTKMWMGIDFQNGSDVAGSRQTAVYLQECFRVQRWNPE